MANRKDELIRICKTAKSVMKMRISFRLEILTVLLLLIGITLTVISSFFFTQLDQVVHGNLYNYGLQFSYEWAQQYWTYSRLMMTSIEIAIVVTGISTALILVQVRTHRRHIKFLSCPLLIFATSMIGLAVFFFTRLDSVVHGDLYNYGLQFSYEWAQQYWTHADLILGSLGLTIATNTVSITLILTTEHMRRIQLFPSARSLLRINSILFFSGVLALLLSINFNSSILAFVGLGLVFWGAILFYARPGKYVKENLLLKTVMPSLVNLDQVIVKLGYKGKGVYLPPNYLRDLESSEVFINAQPDIKLPSPEQIQSGEEKIFFKNPEGMLITPPGSELSKLFEETLGTSFTRIDYQQIELNIPRILVEDLEIAQNVQMEATTSVISVKIENTIYKNMYEEAKRFSNIQNSLGCPLSSAIACTLAKATGKPVIIEKNQISEDGQVIDIEYRLLEKSEEKTR